MSGIRVIGGSARGRKLKLVPGDSTRPITDRVKENLFNILGGVIVRATVLDLFAGTGSVGIEALSRGAAYARFVDLNRIAVATVKENLRLTGFEERAAVQQRDALSLLKTVPDRAYDIIYLAPPQYREIWKQSLEALDANPAWLASGGEIIVQIDPKEFLELELVHYEIRDRRKYGNTLLLFYGRPGD